MAVVAIHAVVDVAADTAMLIVGFRFCMAVRALEHAVIVRVRMTSGADSVRATMVRREVCVVESGIEPTARRMARGACRREARAHVIRIGRPAVVLLMATVAIRRQRRVVVVYVAACTRNRRMRAGERKARIVVIKRRLIPRRSVMTNITLLRKSDGCVVWIVRILKISQVARHARRIRKTVVGIDMARAALQRSVGAR